MGVIPKHVGSDTMQDTIAETSKTKGDYESQRYMTIADICNYARISRTLLFRLRKEDNNFPSAVQFGSKTLYPTQALIDYFDRCDSQAAG